tara:strand:+ start:851 stop:1696 length:846 start_codon:yes stop_codon:yes gene_type:complete
LLERQVESRLLLAAAQPRMLVLLAESLRESVMDIGKQCLLAMVVILIGWGLVLPKAAVAAPAPAPALEQLPALEAEVALSFSSGGQDALNDPASFRRQRVGRRMLGAAIGIQIFQVSFAIIARAITLSPASPWAAGDSLFLESLFSLVSIAAAPLGIAGLSRVHSDPSRGAGLGLLEGGIYATSYAGLHLLFSAIAEASESGGQGGGIGILFAVPLVASHLSVGVAMSIAGAVTLVQAELLRSERDMSASEPQGRRRPVALVAPFPLLRSDGGGLGLLVRF